MKDKNKVTTSYKEVRIGNTIYRVTSVFSGEKDLGKAWSNWRSAALWRTWPLPLLTSLLLPALRWLAASLHRAVPICIMAASEKSGESQSPHRV